MNLLLGLERKSYSKMAYVGRFEKNETCVPFLSNRIDADFKKMEDTVHLWLKFAGLGGPELKNGLMFWPNKGIVGIRPLGVR